MKRILSFLITLILFLTSSYCLATDGKSECPTNSSSKELPIINLEAMPNMVNREKKINFSTEKDKAFKNLINKIDASKYSKIDTEYKENMDLILNNINKTQNKNIFAFKFGGIIEYYRVTKGNTTLEYCGNGSLREIIIDSQKEPPSTSYIYNSDGVLKGFIILISSQSKPYMFSSTGTLIPFDSYMHNLQRRIRANWKPYHYQFPDSYSTTISLKLNRNGELLKYELIKKSPNEKYNEMAIDALKKAAPFGTFPTDYFEDELYMDYSFDYNTFNH